MKRIGFCLFLIGILVKPSLTLADFINGNGKTSFAYSNTCTIRGNGINPSGEDCKDVTQDGPGFMDWSYYSSNGGLAAGHATELVPEASNPNGDGPYGLRFRKRDGKNQQTNKLGIDLSTQRPELWMRWYMRFETGYGYGWNGEVTPTNTAQSEKLMYVRAGGPTGASLRPGFDNAGNLKLLRSGSINDGLTGGPKWQEIFSDGSAQGRSLGKWHMMEFYLKMDTNSSNGEGKFWVDGIKVMEGTGIDWSNGNTSTRDGWSWIEFDGNTSNGYFPTTTDPGVGYIDWDDIEIWVTTPPNVSPDGDPWIGPLNGSSGGGGSPPPIQDGGGSPPPIQPTSSMPVEVFFNDPIEDNNFASRGWYDNSGTPTLASDGASTGSTNSLEAAYPISGRTASWGRLRRTFPETDNVYLSYYVKYSSNWVGSQQSFHPHEFYFMTNKDGNYPGPASSQLTLYVEQVDLLPKVNFANPANTAGSGGGAPTSSTTTMSKDTWHRVEAFFKLNTMSGSNGNSDGVFKYWLDGNLEIDRSDLMMRDGAGNEDMLINKFMISPFIGSGSPVAQTMWIDELILGTENGGAIPNTPSPISVD